MEQEQPGKKGKSKPWHLQQVKDDITQWTYSNKTLQGYKALLIVKEAQGSTHNWQHSVLPEVQ